MKKQIVAILIALVVISSLLTVSVHSEEAYKPIIQSVTVSPTEIVNGGEVTLTVIAKSNAPVNYLSYHLDGPNGCIHGGGGGATFTNIGDDLWKHEHWPYTVSEWDPSGTYTYSHISVENEGQLTSDEWGPIIFNVTRTTPPEITSHAPESPVNDTICTWRTFNVTVNQSVNVSWYLNGSMQQTNESVTEASCTLHANVSGKHNVTAIARNVNGTDSQTWIWNVRVSNCTCGDICVNETGWWRDGDAFNPSDTPIQAATDNATAGETICVKDGTYTENVDVKKRLTIQSENGADYTTVQAASSSDHVFAVTADYVTISGFTVKGASDSYGISIKNSHYCEVHDNIVSFSDDRGIVFGGGGNNYAYNNIVHNNSAYGAIEAIHSDNNTIYNNTAYYNRWGIATNGGSNNWIHNNTIYENDHGVYLDWPSTGNTVSNNIISSNAQGIFTNHNSTDNIITGNSVFSNTDKGIHILTGNNIIDSNTVTSNGDGVLLSSASNNLITNNDVSNNDNGICLLESSDHNTVLNNIANSNARSGIWIFGSLYNNLTENTANLNNRCGIALAAISKHNIISKNTANSNNYHGIIVKANSSYESETHPWGPSDNNIISGNTADTNNRCGIYLWEGSSNNAVLGNTVSSNSWDGISLHTSSNNIIKNNIANSNNDGIHLYPTSNYNLIQNNILMYNYDGIDLDPSTDNIIIDNTANFNTDDGISLDGSKNCKIINNTANFNNGDEGNGIELDYSCENNIVMSNRVSNNNHGIELQYSNINNTIINNTASNNLYGIYIFDSSNNLIYNNYFDNTNNAYDDENNIWNTTKKAGTNIVGGSWLGGNYWSDYAGEDTNGDGLGDTLLPYNSGGEIIIGGDWHPLVPAGIAPPEICTDPDPPSHDFGEVPEGETREWTFYIINCGGGTLIWNVSDDQPWITVSPTNGTTTATTATVTDISRRAIKIIADTVTVTIDTTDLECGITHTGTINISSNGGTKEGIITVYVLPEFCCLEVAVCMAGVSDPEGILNPLRELRDDYLKDEYVDRYYDYCPELTMVVTRDPALAYEAARLLVKYSPMVKQEVYGIGKVKLITRRDVQEIVSVTNRLKRGVWKNRDEIGAERSRGTIKFLDEFKGQIRASEGKTFSEALQGSIYCEDEQICQTQMVDLQYRIERQ